MWRVFGLTGYTNLTTKMPILYREFTGVVKQNAIICLHKMLLCDRYHLAEL
jgi:hypothetical protein